MKNKIIYISSFILSLASFLSPLFLMKILKGENAVAGLVILDGSVFIAVFFIWIGIRYRKKYKTEMNIQPWLSPSQKLKLEYFWWLVFGTMITGIVIAIIIGSR